MDIENDFTVFFDNFDLNTIPYVFLTRRNPNEEASIAITAHDMVRRDGQVVTSVKHGAKNLVVEGYIVAPTRTSYEEALDTLKYRTSGLEKRLAVIQAGSSRKYIATKQTITLEHIEAGKAKIAIAFKASYPFGTEETLTVVTGSASSTPSALGHTFLGSAPARPTIKVTVSALSGGTGKYVGIGNSSTGQQVQITRNWTAGDVVIFNMETQKCYVNGVITDYSGVFPEFQAQSADAYYYDNLTTRTANWEISYAKQFL